MTSYRIIYKEDRNQEQWQETSKVYEYKHDANLVADVFRSETGWHRVGILELED